MLRRVARALRVLLFAAGIGLTVWFVASHYFVFTMTSDWPGARSYLLSSGGVIQGLFFAETDRAFPFFDSPGMDFRRIGSDIGGYTFRDMVWPSFQRWEVTGSYQLNIPLSLLAFLCLAWPVTSFIIARRRRRGRGFPVEAKAGDAVSTVDS